MTQLKQQDLGFFKKCQLLNYERELSMKRSEGRWKQRKSDRRFWQKMSSMRR